MAASLARFVRGVRKKTGLSQGEFSKRFGISVKTVQHWELGERRPDGAARSYLKVIRAMPEEVAGALKRVRRRK
jgi:putative transcriptional regulator